MNIIDTHQGLMESIQGHWALVSITDICVSLLPCMVIHPLSLGLPSTGSKCAFS